MDENLIIDENCGMYFKSKYSYSSYFFIQILHIQEGSNCSVVILKGYNPIEGVNSGSIITEGHVYDYEAIIGLDLWGKHYQLTYEQEYIQQYYDGKKYYGESETDDENLAIADCINKAIEIGLKEAKIKPY